MALRGWHHTGGGDLSVALTLGLGSDLLLLASQAWDPEPCAVAPELDLQAEVLSSGSAVSTAVLSALHFEQLKSMEFI